jgi:hypothetical protein
MLRPLVVKHGFESNSRTHCAIDSKGAFHGVVKRKAGPLLTLPAAKGME